MKQKQSRSLSRKNTELPTALTIIKRIALSDGVLKKGEYYLTKYQMIALCKNWLRFKGTNR